MDKKLIELAKESKFETAMMLAFLSVETGGRGFDEQTGKILIQFEPKWFKKKEPYAPSGKWSINKVDVQKKEWEAFNNAFSIDKTSAMECTSIGLGQIMGFHWKMLGYNSVNEMWDDAKKGIEQQFYQLEKFIEKSSRLASFIRIRSFVGIASVYNGAYFRQQAERLGIEPYDIQMQNAYNKFKKLYK